MKESIERLKYRDYDSDNRLTVFLFAGPAFWGLINPEWSLCNKGRRQSPVNLEPSKLLFDPNLRPLHVDKHRVSGLPTLVLPDSRYHNLPRDIHPSISLTHRPLRPCCTMHAILPFNHPVSHYQPTLYCIVYKM